MENVNLVFNYKGRWVHTPNLSYIEGESSHVENVDIDFLSFTHMIKRYREEFQMLNVTKLMYQKHGETHEKGLVLIENDTGIREMTKFIRDLSVDDIVHIFPVEDVRATTYLSSQGSAYIGECLGIGSIDDNDTFMSELIDALIADEVVEGDPIDNGNGEHVVQHSSKGKEVVQTDDDVFDLVLESENDEDQSDSSSEKYAFDSEVGVIHMKLMNQSTRKVKYDIDASNPHFMLGMTFHNASEARLANARYSIAKSTPLKITPNEAKRLRAKCKTDGCPFHLFISSEGKNGALMVKRIDDEHTCLRDANKTTTKDLKLEAERQIKLCVSKYKCKRAKKIILDELDGSYKAEYANLGAYVSHIRQTNPNSNAHLEFCEESLKVSKFVFKRIYICFDAIKRGWRGGSRPIIGLDGSHLKGDIKGQILAAVGKDGNDQIFSIAWAVVSIENKENWVWFIQLLVRDLQIGDGGKKLTIVSNMQKGLVRVVSEELPFVEHRYCARHVYANWSKKWHGGELKKRFWITCWSTFKEDFDDNLRLLGDLSKQAAEDFVAYNPRCFCRAFFSSRCKSNIVDNNMSESFNSSTAEARDKLIISMLEEIRQNTMKRLASHKASVHTWTRDWSPNCMQTYQDNLELAFGCSVISNGENEYEVGDGDDRHCVYLDKMLCTCRAWDLTWIPCSHAICAIKHAKMDPKAFISDWYHKTKYMVTYEHSMRPIPGKKFMLSCGSIEQLEPPPMIQMSGRPRKKRIRGSHESLKGKTSEKLSRKEVKLRCTICRSADHNRAKCPNKGSEGTCTDKEKNIQTQQLFKARNRRRTTGLGIYINEQTRNMILNPGFQSETLIRQSDVTASQTLVSDPDPNIKYPIPNEKELRRAKQASRSYGSRKIIFVGDGSQSITPTNLPFKAPGLKWKGKPSVTASQLHIQREKKRARTGNKDAST